MVLVDLGCGNAIAQRQGKKHFKEAGLGMERLVAVGYDLLPIDMFEYGHSRKQNPARYNGDDFSPEFAPIILAKNIRRAIFLEAPDIVTCFQVVQWTEYPLEILANAASQVERGAVLNFTKLGNFTGYSRMKSRIGKVDYIFHTSSEPDIHIRGFDIPLLDKSPSLPDPLIMIRNGEHVEDFMFGLKRVGSRHEWDMKREDVEREFTTYYTKK